MHKCAKEVESYPQTCAQNKWIINNPHVNNQITNKVIHIFTGLYTIGVDKSTFRLK